jgi:PKD repeat protein
VAVADFQNGPGCSQLEAFFFDKSQGEIVAWHWNFGDGQESTAANPLHVFPEPGTYDVLLTVWDVTGASGTASIHIAINGVGDCSPAPAAAATLPGASASGSGSTSDDGSATSTAPDPSLEGAGGGPLSVSGSSTGPTTGGGGPSTSAPESSSAGTGPGDPAGCLAGSHASSCASSHAVPPPGKTRAAAGRTPSAVPAATWTLVAALAAIAGLLVLILAASRRRGRA